MKDKPEAMTKTEPKPGDRVYALLDMNGKNARLLGYGVYEGDFPAPGSEPFEEFWKGLPEELKKAGLEQSTLEECKESYLRNPFINNPRIKLDSGHTVWGMQCWWGPEQELKEQPGLNIIQINMDEWTKETA